MCVHTRARAHTHTHAPSHTWSNGLIGFRSICIWMQFPKYSSNKRSLRTVLIIVFEESLYSCQQSNTPDLARQPGDVAGRQLTGASLTSTPRQRGSWRGEIAPEACPLFHQQNANDAQVYAVYKERDDLLEARIYALRGQYVRLRGWWIFPK